jgi:hypothetical protein
MGTLLSLVRGLVLNKIGRSREAETYLRESLEIRTRLLPEGNQLTAAHQLWTPRVVSPPSINPGASPPKPPLSNPPSLRPPTINLRSSKP